VDIDLTRKHILKILAILKVPDFSVFLLICSDAKMREINKNLRLKSKSTDILSYSLPEGAYDPLSGVKEGPAYLGTLVICPAFVDRQMLADKEAYEVGV
jgi:ssRNA-specific RNase YbeY (16S rRNA maturation enzyme)